MAANETDTCESCGLLYVHGSFEDERYHRRFHEERIDGHKSKLGDGFYVVTHESLKWLQRLAQAAAIAAKRDTGYDFPSFVASKEADDSKTIAAIYIYKHRVIALIVTREHSCEYHAALDSFFTSFATSRGPAEFEKVEPHPRRAIEMIWVLKAQRRKGVARRLIVALAQRCSLKVEDFAHMTPFSDDAVALWRSFKLTTVYLV